MSVNPMAVKYQAAAARDKPLETTLSIFSDYEDIEVALVDGESYVLFNPVRHQELDILSLTNTQETFSEVDDEAHAPPRTAPAPESNQRHPMVRQVHLLNKISKWYQTTLGELEEVDDNVALWNLDENLRASTAPSGLFVREFYGDDLFKLMDKQDVRKVKRITRDMEAWLRRGGASNTLSAVLSTHAVKGGDFFGPVVSRSSSVSVTS